MAVIALAQDILPVRWQQPGAIVQEHLQFSEDGNYLLTWNSGRPGMVTMRDGVTKKVLWQYGQTSVIGASFYNLDAGVLVSSDVNTYRLDRQTGRVLGPWNPYEPIVGYITNVPGTNTVITSNANEPSKFRSVLSGTFRNLPFTFATAAAAKELVISPFGRVAAAQGKIVDLNTGNVLSTYPAGSPLAFLNKTDYIYSPGQNKLTRRKTDGALVWERDYYSYREIISGGDPYKETYNFFFRTIALKNAKMMMAGGGQIYEWRGPGEIGAITTVLVWNLNPENGDLTAVASPHYVYDYVGANWTGFIFDLAAAINADRFAFQYIYRSFDFYYQPPTPRIFPLLNDPTVPFPVPNVPGGLGFGGVVSPPPLNGNPGQVTFLTPGDYGAFYKVNRQTGSDPVQVKAYYRSVGSVSPMSVSWDSTLFAYTSTKTGTDPRTTVMVGRSSDLASNEVWKIVARSAPVFIGNSLLAFTEGQTTIKGRIVAVLNANLLVTTLGTFPGTELPIAGRRDGAGFATLRDGVISYFNLTGANPIVSTLKGSFPTLKKAAGDVVLAQAATFTSGDNLAVIVAIRRASSLKTELEYRLLDVKSATMRTLDSRTLVSYSSAWQTAQFVLAISRDGAQAAALLDQLTIEGGYNGQVDFVRTSDGIFNGRFSNQQIGWGFVNATFTSDTRSLVATRRDGTGICYAVPPQLYSLSAPNSATSGSTLTVNVQLRGSAAPGGTLLRVSYPNGNITGPGVVLLPEGATTGSFTVTATGAAGTTGDIRAYIGTDVKIVSVTIN